MEKRTLLPEGYILNGGSRTYIIEKYVSAGSNSIVYQAYYKDTLMPDHRHTILLKELYPLDDLGRIYRDSHWSLIVPKEAENFFEYHKSSYLLGNQAHLTLAAHGSERIAQNLDSFEANNTIYTVLTSKKGQVLSEALAGGRLFPTLTDTIHMILNILKALQVFHGHGLLHLDISPDNIFLLDNEDGAFPTEVLLLDFNSVYNMNDKDAVTHQYYWGKEGYMAPEIILHKNEEVGPWTDLYSVTVVWYEILADHRMEADRELMDFSALISPYSRLLLHEKEQSALFLNTILKKGLEVLPENRYQNVDIMLKDVLKLLDIVSGRIREPMAAVSTAPSQVKRRTARRHPIRLAAASAALLLAGGAAGAMLMSQVISPNLQVFQQPESDTPLDLSQIPLEIDDTLILTEKNNRQPLRENQYVMRMQVQSSMSVRATLKDYTHPRDTSDVFQSYGIFCIYNSNEDKRGWQFADLTYDFFYTPDNALHMELPFQDTNDFSLDYIGVIFANYNYTETSVLLDISDCTLIDGEGEEHEITELEGSHILFFDEENWQWNLMTTQNQDYVDDFKDIYGGRLVVDAQVCYLDPVLDITFESDNPEIASIDEQGRIFANRQGQAKITVTVTDKTTQETRRSQMIVNVISKLG